MNDQVWEVDDIIQISPTYDKSFGGSCLVVTEIRSWGVLGYIATPKYPQSVVAPYRLPFISDKEHCDTTGVKVGRAHWLMCED